MRGAIAAIAANTVRDAVRNRVLYALVFFALVMIGTSAVLATLSYVERERILQDVGLGAIRFFGAAIAIFMGVGLIHREVERPERATSPGGYARPSPAVPGREVTGQG